MCCVWKINRKLVEIMEALDGILHTFILPFTVLSGRSLPLPDTGSCPCPTAVPCGAGIRAWSPHSIASARFPSSKQCAEPGTLPGLPAAQTPHRDRVCSGTAVAGARPGSASCCHNCREVPLKQPIACPAAPLCSFPQQKGSNYQKTLQKAWGKGQGTSTGGTQNIRKSVGSIRRFIKLLPGAWRHALFMAAGAEG